MSINLQKTAELTNGLAVSTFGLFLWLTMLYLSLVDGESCSLLKILTWLSVSILAIGLIEVGLFWINKSQTIQATNLDALPEKNPISQTAGAAAVSRAYFNLITYPILILFLTGLFYLVVSSNAGKPLVFCALFYSHLFLMVFYIFIRQRLAQALNPRLQKIIDHFNTKLPSYEIKNNQIQLDLKIKNTRFSNSQSLIVIDFTELNEIKILNYPEAKAFLNYKIGPDMILAVESIKDMYRYLKQEIPKPRYYSKISSSGSVLLLKGPELFYLLSISNLDHQALLKAFKQAKNL